MNSQYVDSAIAGSIEIDNRNMGDRRVKMSMNEIRGKSRACIF